MFYDKTLIQVKKYLIISVLGYGLIFSMLYLFVDILNLKKSFSFAFIYGLNYLFLYIIQLKSIFKKTHNKEKLIKFIINILFFYLLGNLIYNMFLEFNFHYLIATISVVIILFPIRFLVSKKIVFK